MPRPRPGGPALELYRGRYAIVYFDGGSRRRVSTGTANPTIARQALADWNAEAERRPLALTVGQALSNYATARAGKVMAPKRQAEAMKPLHAALGALRVDQITQAEWDRYAAGRVTKPRPRAKKHVPQPVAAGTLRREFNVLRAALRLAWKDGALPRPPTLATPADSAPRDRYLTKDEARSLLAACKSPHVKVFLALALFTGARKQSILSLTWEQVDFRTGTVDFQEPGRPITDKRRAIVPMNASLRAVMDAAQAARQTDYVVEYAGGPVPTGLRWSWRRLCSNAGLKWTPTPHHIKHSVVSWLAMDGIPLGSAADLLATDERTLRRVYRKFDPAYLRGTVAALDL